MPMTPFYTHFPELAFNEMRSLAVKGKADLPDGEYGFLELYCDEPGCDCRRVIIDVISPATQDKIWATINYGWEDVAFYEEWMGSPEDAVDCKGPSLDPFNPQTEYSPALLGLFALMLNDETYVERLKRHYELFKEAVRDKHRPQWRPSGPRRRLRRVK